MVSAGFVSFLGASNVIATLMEGFRRAHNLPLEAAGFWRRRLRALARRVDPLWISDHVSWTGIDGFQSHDLLPLPYTEEALDNIGLDRHQQHFQFAARS